MQDYYEMVRFSFMFNTNEQPITSKMLHNATQLLLGV